MFLVEGGSGGRRRIVILAEGCFTALEAKTAYGLIRYKPENVAAVIDSTRAGKTAQEILGLGGKIPVVKDVLSSLPYKPEHPFNRYCSPRWQAPFRVEKRNRLCP